MEQRDNIFSTAALGTLCLDGVPTLESQLHLLTDAEKGNIMLTPMFLVFFKTNKQNRH